MPFSPEVPDEADLGIERKPVDPGKPDDPGKPPSRRDPVPPPPPPPRP